MHLAVFLALPLSPRNSLDFYLEANISVSAGIDAYILFSVLALVSEVRWTLSVINCRRSSIADCVWLQMDPRAEMLQSRGQTCGLSLGPGLEGFASVSVTVSRTDVDLSQKFGLDFYLSVL